MGDEFFFAVDGDVFFVRDEVVFTHRCKGKDRIQRTDNDSVVLFFSVDIQ